MFFLDTALAIVLILAVLLVLFFLVAELIARAVLLFLILLLLSLLILALLLVLLLFLVLILIHEQFLLILNEIDLQVILFLGPSKFMRISRQSFAPETLHWN